MNILVTGAKGFVGRNLVETLKCMDVGQFSINVSKPGKTKGQHWHHTKMEIFLVVSGHGLIQERRIGIDPETRENYPGLQVSVGTAVINPLRNISDRGRKIYIRHN